MHLQRVLEEQYTVAYRRKFDGQAVLEDLCREAADDHNPRAPLALLILLRAMERVR